MNIRSVLVLTALSIGQITSSANADTNLNCDAYAQAAIDQQAKNMALKCGLSGKAWSTNYNGHKNWCLSNGVGIVQVSDENRNRETALKSCGQKKIFYIPMALKDCNKYAQNAIDQQTANIALKCGKSGKGWSTNYNAHKNWCETNGVSVAMINTETSRRGVAVGACLFKN